MKRIHLIHPSINTYPSTGRQSVDVCQQYLYLHVPAAEFTGLVTQSIMVLLHLSISPEMHKEGQSDMWYTTYTQVYEGPNM